MKTLVLGLGNILMGDEGIGVYTVRALEQHKLPPNVECLDGGTGGFTLLEPLQTADRIILIDAAAHEIVLYAITIDPHQPIRMSLSPEGAAAAEVAAQEILLELRATAVACPVA